MTFQDSSCSGFHKLKCEWCTTSITAQLKICHRGVNQTQQSSTYKVDQKVMENKNMTIEMRKNMLPLSVQLWVRSTTIVVQNVSCCTRYGTTKMKKGGQDI